MIRPSRRLALCSAVAAALVSAAPARAQSSVSIYGLIDMSAGRFQLAGTPKLWRADSGNMSTSFLGFSGKEDLGGGLSAVFAIEHFLRVDTGAAGRFNADGFWTRSAFVGLGSSTLGTVKLGRNTNPFFVSTLAFNAFGDSFGFSPVIRQYFGDRGALVGDSGWSNSLVYSSPSFSGFSVNLAGNLAEGTANGTGRNLGGNLLYFSGPLSLTFAAQETKNNALGGVPIAGFDKQTAYLIGGSFDFGVAKLFAQYGQVKTDLTAAADPKYKIYSLGTSVPLGAGAVLAQYSRQNVDNLARGDSTVVTVGYDYGLSKRTDVYAVYMNDRLSGGVPSGHTYAAGIRHKF